MVLLSGDVTASGSPCCAVQDASRQDRGRPTRWFSGLLSLLRSGKSDSSSASAHPECLHHQGGPNAPARSTSGTPSRALGGSCPQGWPAHESPDWSPSAIAGESSFEDSMGGAARIRRHPEGSFSFRNSVRDGVSWDALQDTGSMTQEPSFSSPSYQASPTASAGITPRGRCAELTAHPGRPGPLSSRSGLSC
jgi:hypothetical protein